MESLEGLWRGGGLGEILGCMMQYKVKEVVLWKMMQETWMSGGL